MSPKNKCAELGIYILFSWSLLVVSCFLFFVVNKKVGVGSQGLVNSFIMISVYVGAMTSALTLLIGLASLSYKPKKLAVFLVFASLLIFIRTFGEMLTGAVS